MLLAGCLTWNLRTFEQDVKNYSFKLTNRKFRIWELQENSELINNITDKAFILIVLVAKVRCNHRTLT